MIIANNIKLKIFILITIAFFFCQCQPDTAILKFKYDKYGQILVPITLCDTMIYFTFDTGATNSHIVINDMKYNRFPLSDKTKQVHIGYDDTILNFYKTQPIDVHIGNINIKAQNFTLSDSLIYKDRIIGLDFIKQLNWHFDFLKQTVEVGFKTFDASKFCVQIPYILQQNTMFCILKIFDDIEIFIIDTGLGILIHNKKFSGYNPILHTSDSAKMRQMRNVIFSNNVKEHVDSTKCELFLFDSLTINDYVYKNSSIYYDKNVAGQITALPVNFFKQFEQMYIDTKEQIIYLKPYEESNK